MHRAQGTGHRAQGAGRKTQDARHQPSLKLRLAKHDARKNRELITDY